MKIIIASDSFKGCLSSSQVAEASMMGIKQVIKGCQIIPVEVSDGGEGLISALEHIPGSRHRVALVHDPLGRPIKASYLTLGETAVIEMASASGITLLADNERNPMETSSRGTGELLADALKNGYRKVLMGIGGSATNDGGTGMLEALGWKFRDRYGQLLKGKGSSLESIAEIESSDMLRELHQACISVACDVNNPFCGPDGASFVFGPQKGASDEMVRILDRGMEHFSKIILKTTGVDILNTAGAGAAGGVGGASKAFLNARLCSGIDLVLDTIGFDHLIEGADLVITGEGRMDSQTPSGKTAAGVLRRAKAAGIPVIAICGAVQPCRELEEMGFRGIVPVTPRDCPLSEAMNPAVAAANITRTVSKIISSLC